MAEAKEKATGAGSEQGNGPVTLVEGARILIQTTVYESTTPDKNGQTRHIKPESTWQHLYPVLKVKVRTEDGARYLTRNLVYPAPAGLLDDPFTKKPAKANMTPQEIAVAISNWVKDIEAMEKAGGTYVVKDVPQADGTVKDVPGKSPMGKLIPSFPEVFNKGFSLEIQGPVNQQLAKDCIEVRGGTKKKAPVRATAFDNFG